ncbi:MAG TPA: peptidylprolyl isomerase [Tepidisphaeraceae bacterium]|nr:peptidylprolyl isomerase [Tepidisphaeraceae bacterium]
MKIADKSVVSFDYTLTDPDGKELDSSKTRGPLVYMHGMRGIIPGLEAEMTGKSAGDAFKVTVDADKAYGMHNPALTQTVPRTNFPPNQMLMVGQEFQAKGPNGQPFHVRITKLDGDNVTVDANHPLAGVALTFDVKVVDVREATEEEIAHGHVHGPGGHQH